MREYGKVFTAFWTSEDVQGMSEDERLLALYLLTCPHGNMLGCYRLPSAYAAEDIRWELSRVEDGLSGLGQKGFIYRCTKSTWTFIRLYLKWNVFENPNVGKAAGKLFDSIGAPHDVKALLAEAIMQYSQHYPEAKMKEIELSTKGLGGVELNPSVLSSKTRTSTGAITGVGTESGEGAKGLVPPGGGDEEDGTKPKKFHGTPDDHKTVKWMFERIRKVNATAREPNWDHWANDVRLMREIDGRTHSEICELFQWVGKDTFWCTVILSPANLRQKWDQLIAKRSTPTTGRNGKPDNFVLGDVDHSSSQEAMKATMDRLGLETPPEGTEIKF